MLETRTSPGPASAQIRAAMWTAIPPMSSPVELDLAGVQPGPDSIPSGATAVAAIARAQRIARAGPSKVARNAVPVVLTSRPRKRSS